MLKGKIKVTWEKKDFKNLKFEKKKYVTNYNGNLEKKYMKKFNNFEVFLCNKVGKKLTKIAEKFRLKKTVVAVNKMIPGQVLPFHSDKYKVYMKKNNIKNSKKIIRIIVFLENSLPGQQLWIKDKLCYAKAGSYFGWKNQVNHMAANLSEKDRYVLQITGLKA